MESKRNKPNILLFTTDQQRWDAWGLMNPVIKTPHLDRLFADGVRWRHAVCQVPMCIPSRYSYMTGLYPSQIGSRVNAQTFQNPAQVPVPVLAEYLQEAGYQTIGCGKTHYAMAGDAQLNIPAPVPSNRGFQHRAVSNRRGTGEAGPSARYWPEEDSEASALFAEIELQGSQPFPAGGEGLHGYRGSYWPLGLNRTREGWATRCALEFLHDCVPSGKPWFLNLSYDLPHAPFCTVPEYERLYQDCEFDIPATPPPHLLEHWGIFENTANFLVWWNQQDAQAKRAVMIKYFAMCSMLDALFGEVVAWLECNGQLDNTWILFTSDHGESLGSRGRFSKYSLYEASVRVPLALTGPGIPEQQRGTELFAPAELIDVLPTLLDVAGIEVPPWLPGRRLLRDPARRGSFAELHGSGAEQLQAAPVYMWRTPEWKLILRLQGKLFEVESDESEWQGELYHLSEDPSELCNVYQEPAFREIRESMTLALLKQLACANAKYPHPDSRPGLRP
ncbi:MAG: sulfatase-like hydrolase/transferase [Verrucomicrobia bacterium]|nr:sulfatase-like hydrolase/transferase [Verrucomicrobiota bacterium]